jgi:YD repeat-containing protein
MKGRILLSVALVMLGRTVPSLAAVRAGVTTYRVQLVLYPGDDGAAVAKRLAAMYRGRLETAVDEGGSFSIALSPATADLMGRDPAVHHLELAETTPAPMVTTAAGVETTAVATPWKLGDYQYDGSGNIRRIGADFYAYDNRNRLVLSADASQSTLVPKQSYTYDNFGNLTSITTAGTGLTTMGVNTSSNRLTAVTAAGASTTTGYDQAGNMTRYGTASYTYDALNMLTRSTFDNVMRYYVYSRPPRHPAPHHRQRRSGAVPPELSPHRNGDRLHLQHGHGPREETVHRPRARRGVAGLHARSVLCGVYGAVLIGGPRQRLGCQATSELEHVRLCTEQSS